MTSPHPRSLLVYDEKLTNYSYGDTHPMGPDRVRLSVELGDYFGLLDYFDLETAPEADPQLIASVHEEEYLQALASGQAHPDKGIGTQDQPVVPHLPEIAAHVVSGTVTAAQAVWNGRYNRAINLAGGLHHAGAGAQSGFCMLNDAAVAIQWLLDHGATRIAYLDLDAHHGDGVEQIFWNDPRVLTISIHESGLYLFPGTGFGGDIGGPDALGTAINVALEPETQDLDWLYSVHGIVPPILQKFRPQILITQHGADGHLNDPLTHLQLSVDAMAKSYRSVSRWVDRFCGGKWVALGGGGYNRDSVARTWVQVMAAVAGVKLDPLATMPTHWAERTMTNNPSATLGDIGALNVLKEYHPERVLSDTPTAPVLTTSKAVFPYWGLEPYRG
ncbi:acetoin utilization protein AcuC [Corynebacterium aquilae]|uniref:Acetoin utilization protein AcuC n=1 Tax=Corynebacterium aquilae DSM 44791 TaxID=1431546 RepID=A0A1L7CHT2_9CORY|nr:acetoin utilization protein AcuC [Corynebacterium aquilae]APT85412.1 acetoin dehydrogenase [Corynebacterium aquilae DSM 44791]